MSKRIVLAEETHIVNVLPAIDIAGGATGDVFSMENHDHVSFIISVGVSAAAFTKILVNECTSLAAAGATAIPFRLYKEETALGDTLDAGAAVAATGYTPSANDGIMYIVEVDAAALSEGSHFLQLSLTNASGNSIIASAIAVLTGNRYSGSQSATAIA